MWMALFILSLKDNMDCFMFPECQLLFPLSLQDDVCFLFLQGFSLGSWFPFLLLQSREAFFPQSLSSVFYLLKMDAWIPFSDPWLEPVERDISIQFGIYFDEHWATNFKLFYPHKLVFCDSEPMDSIQNSWFLTYSSSMLFLILPLLCMSYMGLHLKSYNISFKFFFSI